MNPYANYANSYPLQSQYGWYPPYYYSDHEFYKYYNSNAYNIPAGSYYSPIEVKNYYHTQPDVIKVQEDSGSVAQNSNGENHIQPKKKEVKQLKKKQVIPKAPIKVQQIYLHPPKQVKHKVKYFDPSAAPVITSEYYNLVEGDLKENERTLAFNNIQIDQINQLAHPQIDQKPFIVFKLRRIKKKFKKYIKPKDQFYFLNKNKESDSQNDLNNSSESSESEENFEEKNKTLKKVIKIQLDSVQNEILQEKKVSKTQQSPKSSIEANRKFLND